MMDNARDARWRLLKRKMRTNNRGTDVIDGLIPGLLFGANIGTDVLSEPRTLVQTSDSHTFTDVLLLCTL